MIDNRHRRIDRMFTSSVCIIRVVFVVFMLLQQLAMGFAQDTAEYWIAKAEEQKSLTGEMNANYALYLNNAAYYYNRMGDYKNACLYSKECLRIRKEVVGIASKLYAQTLQNLATYYRNNKQYESALSTSFEELRLDSLYRGSTNIRIAEISHNIASDYLSIGNATNALFYGQKSLNLKRECSSTKPHSLANLYL